MTADTPLDYYAVLGVRPDATSRQVKTAYRKLAANPPSGRLPRRPGSRSAVPGHHRRLQRLSDPVRRKVYDRDHPPAPGTGHHRRRASPRPPAACWPSWKSTWTAIRRNHPQIPPVVIIIASGTDSKQPRWGHYASAAGTHGNVKHAEVMISGEGLARTPADVLGTLLHEAAHALAAARGITDTSRQGRYHNKKYAAAWPPSSAWTSPRPPASAGPITTVPDATAGRYASQLALLKDAMTMWRNDEHAPAAANGAAPT